jgi:DNA-binding beta-propeller fold protein YncE
MSSYGTNGLDVDLETGLVYVANNSGTAMAQWCGKSPAVKPNTDTLNVIDPAAGQEIAVEPTDRAPIWPLIDPERNVLYVATSSGTVAIHAKGTGELTNSVNVGGVPHATVLNPETDLLVVTNSKDGTQEHISIVNVESRSLIRHLKVPKFPHPAVMDAEKGLAYVLSLESGMVTVVDMVNGQIVTDFETSAPGDKYRGAAQMAFSPDTRQLYLTRLAMPDQPYNIYVVDADTGAITGRVPGFVTGKPAWGIAVDEVNRLIYAVIGDSRQIGVADMDTLKPLALIETDECPWAVKLDVERGLGFITTVTKSTLNVFDLNKVKQAVGK